MENSNSRSKMEWANVQSIRKKSHFFELLKIPKQKGLNITFEPFRGFFGYYTFLFFPLLTNWVRRAYFALLLANWLPP